jgi:hypothetical protein
MIDHSIEVNAGLWRALGNGNLSFPFTAGASGEFQGQLYGYLNSISVTADNCTGEEGNLCDVVVTLVQDFPDLRYTWAGIRKAARELSIAITALEGTNLDGNVQCTLIDINSSSENRVTDQGLTRLVKDVRFSMTTKEPKPIN